MYVRSPVVTNIECSNKINQISVFIPTGFLNGVYTTMVYDQCWIHIYFVSNYFLERLLLLENCLQLLTNAC